MITYIALVIAILSVILNFVNFYKDNKFRKEIESINRDINSIVKDTDDIKNDMKSCPPKIADNRLLEIENVLKSRGFMHK